ncbi:MAG: hypothetical protein EOQ95_15360 [Mesorhizobium sp.]|nr:MAG: hypothetical protein EOQ95_15360 [Mesorhizobium sp.]RWQ52848.1 MAG: hypothetical protein EOS84_16730 [Mesorhizobium sp.]
MAETPLHFVILGRSKERSDAAQTLGSMPLPNPKNSGGPEPNATTPFREKARATPDWSSRSARSSTGAASASATFRAG